MKYVSCSSFDLQVSRDLHVSLVFSLLGIASLPQTLCAIYVAWWQRMFNALLSLCQSLCANRGTLLTLNMVVV